MKIYEWILESKRHTPTNDKNLAMSWLYGNRIQPCMLIESLDLENDIVIPEKLKKIINDRPTIEAYEMSEWLDQEIGDEKTFAYGINQKVLCALISKEFYNGIQKVYKVIDHIQYGIEDYIIESISDKVQYPVSEHELVAVLKGTKPYVCMDITFRVHDYAMEHLVGKENAMSGKSLSELFGVSERAFRGIRANHNDPKSGFHHLLLSCNSGYFIAAAPTPDEMKQQYLDTAYRLIHHAVSELREAKALIANTKLDGTMRLKLTPYMKEVVEIGTLWGDEN